MQSSELEILFTTIVC